MIQPSPSSRPASAPVGAAPTAVPALPPAPVPAAPPPPPDRLVALPTPVIKKMRWPLPFIWIVPLIAGALAFYYYRSHLEHLGPQIVIQFADASGLKPGQTPITQRGVPIGQVKSVELAPHGNAALVHVAIDRQYATVATKGAFFWIVRPEISGFSVSGLGTVVSGPFIEALPGNGDAATSFVGLEKAPLTLGQGLPLVLRSSNAEHLQINSPVYYKGIQVGFIQDTQLSYDASYVNVYVLIQHRYRNLVRTNSEFWSISGADVKGGIFSGISVRVDSIRSLISGGIAFATPDKDPGDPVDIGAEFLLHDEADKKWPAWSPRLELLPDGPPDAPDSTSSTTDSPLQSLKKGK